MHLASKQEIAEALTPMFFGLWWCVSHCLTSVYTMEFKNGLERAGR
jgi:hypothetical protein